MIECPKCGGEIELDDVYDVCDHDDFCVGHCLNCNTDYQWREVYHFGGVEDLQEY